MARTKVPVANKKFKTSVAARLATFNEWPFPESPSCTAEMMAMSGYVYDGDGDVYCVFCAEKKTLEWEETDCAFAEHERRAQACSMTEWLETIPLERKRDAAPEIITNASDFDRCSKLFADKVELTQKMSVIDLQLKSCELAALPLQSSESTFVFEEPTTSSIKTSSLLKATTSVDIDTDELINKWATPGKIFATKSATKPETPKPLTLKKKPREVPDAGLSSTATKKPRDRVGSADSTTASTPGFSTLTKKPRDASADSGTSISSISSSTTKKQKYTSAHSDVVTTGGTVTKKRRSQSADAANRIFSPVRPQSKCSTPLKASRVAVTPASSLLNSGGLSTGGTIKKRPANLITNKMTFSKQGVNPLPAVGRPDKERQRQEYMLQVKVKKQKEKEEKEEQERKLKAEREQQVAKMAERLRLEEEATRKQVAEEEARRDEAAKKRAASVERRRAAERERMRLAEDRALRAEEEARRAEDQDRALPLPKHDMSVNDTLGMSSMESFVAYPTNLSYTAGDSDDNDESVTEAEVPKWAKGQRFKKRLDTQNQRAGVVDPRLGGNKDTDVHPVLGERALKDKNMEPDWST